MSESCRDEASKDKPKAPAARPRHPPVFARLQCGSDPKRSTGDQHWKCQGSFRCAATTRLGRAHLDGLPTSATSFSGCANPTTLRSESSKTLSILASVCCLSSPTLSADPVARINSLPGLKATELISAAWATTLCVDAFFRVSQIINLRSSPTEANKLSCKACHATSSTTPVWPRYVKRGCNSRCSFV